MSDEREILKAVTEVVDYEVVLEKRAKDAEGRLSRVGERCTVLAERLARCGQFDHRGKNEVILSVIAELLSIRARDCRGMGDVPF